MLLLTIMDVKFPSSGNESNFMGIMKTCWEGYQARTDSFRHYNPFDTLEIYFQYTKLPLDAEDIHMAHLFLYAYIGIR